MGTEVTSAVPSEKPDQINKMPLFVSVGYLGFVGKKLNPDGKQFVPGTMSHRMLPPSCVALIEEGDIQELEQIDSHRAWRTEDKFGIGKPWPFTSHQTRRSLALYAQRSGLVSLPSLRRQLKHITDEMARYYSRGSAFAKNFIGDDKEHFGLEWQSTQAESSAISYRVNVLLTDQVLFGAHATWVRQQLKRTEGTVLADRIVTLKRFKKGEMAYKETILGGCTNIGPCEKVAVRWLHTACVVDDCKNLVGNASKLDLVITAQTRLIEGLDLHSVEYRTEMQDLQTLIKARDGLKLTKGVKHG